MWRFSLSFIFLFQIVAAPDAASADVPIQKITIEECFKAALAHSSTIDLAKDQVGQMTAEINQAKSGYMPTLSFQATMTEQEESTNPLAKSLSSTHQTTSNLNLNQNIFMGFKDKATTEQRKYLKQGFEWAKTRAVRQLYQDVAQAFYSVLAFKSDIAQYKDQVRSTSQRKSELESAKRSGRARDSDILIAQSSIAALYAAISRTEGLSVPYQESLKYLTGYSSDKTPAEGSETSMVLENVDTWLTNRDNRPDIKQSENEISAATAAVKAAKSGYYPSLGFSANYYLSRPTGIFQGVDWDAGLTFSFPFFSGGLTRSQVAEATVIRHTKEVILRQTEDLATQAIRTAYRTVESDLDQIKTLSDSADLSKRSYDLVHRDNHLGNATNLDVLIALQSWQESKRNLERTRISTAYDFIKLRLESSRMSASESELTGANE